jgi:GrpB-like predicted nucleotidyltransferase (UPF0157 family)
MVRSAIVVPFDPAWAVRAADLIVRLREILGATALRIDHIGSTAVERMAAKDVLDIQASVTDLEEATRAFDAPLRAEGFVRVPYTRDHIPAGLSDDPRAWQKRFWRRCGHEASDANLHVRLLGSPNERVALPFRDWLRAHPAAVPAYGAFKRALAEAVNELDAYAEIKDPVVDLVLAAAEPWASATGWTP